MPIERLTDLGVKNAKPGVRKSEGQPDQRITKMYNDGKGLLLRVAPSGSKSWIYRYKSDGKPHDMGLGPYPERTLAEARELAMEQRRLRLNGKDPLSESKATKRAAAPVATFTFRQVVEEWLKKSEPEWTTKHMADVVSSLSAHAYPVIGHLAIANIDTAAIMRVIEPKWLSKTETMSRVRSRIEAVIGYAVTKGHRNPGENPARWANHLENLLPKKSKVAKPENHAKLPYQDMAVFMARLRAYEGSKPLTAKALEFTILTAARAGEVIGAKWSEIDFEGCLWGIPAERMKMGIEHRVPLSDAAVTLLQSIPRDGELVFGKLVNNSMIRLLDTFGINTDDRNITVHGFRGTFSTWAAEQTSFGYEVREVALAHRVGSDVERRYNTAQFLDQRRRLMMAWADYCYGEAAKVVPIRA